MSENVNPNAKAGRGGKTIEQIYQKKTQLEHILMRPDTYIGAVEEQSDKMWVFDRAKKAMAYKTINYVPGLYKIFDEILVNAADNFVRDPEGMDSIKVEINQDEGYIKVWNNGKGLPIQMHKEHKIWIPEMVFGHLLTSDNYDDLEKKTTGGRNGYGAKLTNIFSSKFVVETADCTVKQKYRQKFENNMGKKHEPAMKSHNGPDYTEVTFYPDFKRFGMLRLDDDIVDFMTKRVYDIAGTSARSGKKGLKVWLNGERLPVRNFNDYVGLYLNDRSDVPRIHEVASERWEFCVSMSEGQFNQVSFVNSIATTKGGTHVAHVSDQLIAAILKKVNAKNKGGMEIKPFHVKNHLWVFVNCLIENPSFDSQTKDTLTLKSSKFGSTCDVKDAVINKVLKCGIVDTVLHWAKSKESLDMKRKLKGATGGSQSRYLGIPKLEDANDAGTKNAELCTLILTEGDSAKSLAVAGLGVIGRNRYGVFPLKGKLLNIRDAPFKQVIGNQEIQNLLKILNLDTNKKYEDGPKGLRYGSIMLMTDQDLDGSHIKGLLMNMFQHWWPNLYKHPGFLKEFVTPIVKVSKGPSMQQFFTLTEYHDWRDDHNGGKGFKVKYYKGLGTSTAAEAKEYFRRIRQHEIMFKYKGDSCDEAIDMAFNKKRADDRKVWINCSKDSDFVDHSKGSLSYTAFVNMELVKFSKYDVVRSIPSVVDGFKPTQRKVLFGAFKRKLTNDVKVAQLVGYVSEQTSYHHGEASLESTIVGMAQDFVGSNNVNLLVPSGQFGTRLQGGKDHASSRYIYTRMTKAARALFPVDDDPVLEYLNDEGQSIEPRYFMPVIPMILVNGGDGIGTGWSCNVSNYNPRDIVANLQRLLKHEPMQTMHPWYAGFQGTITATPKGYDIVGKITKTGDRTLEISELPVRSWTQDYKEFLQEMIVGAQQFQPVKDKDGNMVDPGKDAVMLEDIREYHTESTVHFEVTLSLEKMQLAESIGLEKVFKMRKQTNPNSNMVLFDAKNKVKKYNDVDEIMFDFAETRLEYYHLRKTHMCEKLLRDKVTLDQKVRFVLMVISKELIISNRKKHELMQDLRKHRFPTAKQVSRLTLHEREVKFQKGDFDDEEEEAGQEKEAASGYHYLLGMPLWNLTHEKVEEMKKHALEKKNEFDELMQTSPEQLWWSDLDDVIAALDEVDAKREAALAKSKKIAQLKKEAPKGKKGKGAAEKVEVEEDFDDFDDDDDDKPSKKKLLQVKKSPPVLMPLDLGVQRVTNEAEKEARGELHPEAPQVKAAVKTAAVKTAAAKAADFAAWKPAANVEMEPAAANKDSDSEPPTPPKPQGLLARLLAQRSGAGANVSSEDFFADPTVRTPTPAPAPAAEPAPAVAEPAPAAVAEAPAAAPKRRGRQPKAKAAPKAQGVTFDNDNDEDMTSSLKRVPGDGSPNVQPKKKARTTGKTPINVESDTENLGKSRNKAIGSDDEEETFRPRSRVIDSDEEDAPKPRAPLGQIFEPNPAPGKVPQAAKPRAAPKAKAPKGKKKKVLDSDSEPEFEDSGSDSDYVPSPVRPREKRPQRAAAQKAMERVHASLSDTIDLED